MIAGIDEVGRGCIAGPVMAAAVVLNQEHPIAHLTDSKKLSEGKRRLLASEIKKSSLAWAVGRAEVTEIDRINILQASLLAMKRAYVQLPEQITRVLVDGNVYPDIECAGDAIVQGDLKIAQISAASILAKVARDDEMIFLDRLFPGYGLADHKGYPTKKHLQALHHLGVSVLHRKSYAPVRKLLAAN